MGNRASYLVPAFVSDYWREFYQWARGYAGESPERWWPNECKVCMGAHYVLTKRRELIRCPQWDSQRKTCWRNGPIYE